MRALIAALVLSASSAGAADFALNVGAIEVVGLPPEHLGFYPYVGGSVVIPTSKVALIPGLAIEAAPENGHLGFVGTFVVDYAINERFGIDAQLVGIHDQAGLDFSTAAFFLGAGTGVSIFLGRFTLSPFLNFFVALDGSWAPSLVPGVNLAFTL